jgi:hypothetical protein
MSFKNSNIATFKAFILLHMFLKSAIHLQTMGVTWQNNIMAKFQLQSIGHQTSTIELQYQSRVQGVEKGHYRDHRTAATSDLKKEVGGHAHVLGHAHSQLNHLEFADQVADIRVAPQH